LGEEETMSKKASWFRRLLHKYAGFLFIVCPWGNYHWRWEKECWCGVGRDGQRKPFLLSSTEFYWRGG